MSHLLKIQASVFLLDIGFKGKVLMKKKVASSKLRRSFFLSYYLKLYWQILSDQFVINRLDS